jgi:hypothetical protein
MPETYLQTVEIKDDDAPFAIYSLEFCPVAPCGVLAMKDSAGSTIMWFKDKTVKWTLDKSVFTWLKKPVENDVFRSKGDGWYYEFKSNGTVFAKKNGVPYFWSNPTDCSFVVGSVMNVHVCRDTGGEYFLDSEKCVCPTCYACDKRVEEDGPFCSPECEVSGMAYYRE